MNPNEKDNAAMASSQPDILNQNGCVIWMTGLPGSGKTTIANLLKDTLALQSRLSYVLDGDILRRGLNRDLGFSEKDRHENIRRTSHVSAILADAGLIVIAALISPYENDRSLARMAIGNHRFIECFIDTPPAVCEKRDPKGLWRRARMGEIQNFTGIQAPYDRPINPEIVIETNKNNPLECVEKIMLFTQPYYFFNKMKL